MLTNIKFFPHSTVIQTFTIVLSDVMGFLLSYTVNESLKFTTASFLLKT